MKNLSLSFLLAITCALAGCGGKSSTPPAEPEPGTAAATGTTDCGVADGTTPTNAEQCECMGHTVVGDIGDGQVKCPDGTTEVSRIQYGIEGGVCCSQGDAGPAQTTE